MKCQSSHELSASKAIEYMQLRLSAEQMATSKSQSKIFEDTDLIIEHIRSRLERRNTVRSSKYC